jgi:hypothetical protein
MRVTTRTELLAGAFLLAAFSGCVSTSFHPAKDFEARQDPPVSSSAVLVLRSPPSQAHQTLGKIEAWISGFHGNETVIRKVREAAAAVGADAIVYNSFDDLLAWPSQQNEMETVSPRTVSVSFTAIRYLDSAPHSP